MDDFENDFPEDHPTVVEMSEGYTEHIRNDSACQEAIITGLAKSQIESEFGTLDVMDGKEFIDGFLIGKAFMIRAIKNYIITSSSADEKVDEESIEIEILDTTNLSILVNGRKKKFLTIVH